MLNAHQTYLIEEFVEEYQARRLERRELLKRALLITGSVPLTATTLLALGCGSDAGPAPAASSPTAPGPRASATEPVPTPPPATGPGVTVPPDDPAIRVEEVRFRGPASDVIAYQARPRSGGPHPAVVIIHENRGLVEHIKDVARRYAKEGFVGMAIDLLSRQGGTPGDQTQAAGALGSLSRNPDDLVADLTASVQHLKAQPFVRAGAIGVTGFCFGGGYTFELAIASADIKAAVPYYGTVRQMDRLGETRAAVLVMYGGNDTRVTSQAPQVEERLKAAGKTYEIKVYPGANHAFFNDTSGSYNAEAARDAWQRTLAWFRRYLTG